MLKQTVGMIGAILMAVHMQTAGAGGLRTPTPIPMILSVETDSAAQHLIIAGQKFGSHPPGVTLGGRTLTVSKHSPTQVVADLPADLRPATYLLTVSDKQGRSYANSLYVQIALAKEHMTSLANTK